ncbi:MAG: hypothetical protein E6K17_00145 [Methanobacteriota archaeon]|nr:MAG: hypothetical protein E6K17_00145 [Euryarchaeota archaeon]
MLPNAQGVRGFWSGTITYTPKGLAEGVHEFLLTIGDVAGNLAFGSATVVLDTTAPPLAIEGPTVRYTRANLATITAVSAPGAFVSFGGSWIEVDATGRLTTTVALVPGMNDIRVTAADWFDQDARTGAAIPGNTNEARITIVEDNRAPMFTRAPTSEEPLTRGDGALITGSLSDEIAPGVAGTVATLDLTVAGAKTQVHADGTFTTVVPLSEDDNVIEVLATDLAGNSARAWANVTRDTIAPSLAVDSIPSRVADGRVTVKGQADPGSIVTVNGAVVPLVAGRFSRNVSLSSGDNLIVVRAEDTAGNFIERRFAVGFASGAANPVLGLSLVITVAILAAIFAFLIGRRFLFTPAPPARADREGDKDGTSTENVEPSPKASGMIERAEPMPTETAGEAERVAGPSAREPELAEDDDVLKDLDSSAPDTLTAAPPEDARIGKLREAFESGRISRDVYAANLRRLTKEP